MGQTSRLLLFALSLLIAYIVGAKILDRLSYSRDKRLHGCQDAKKYPHKDPFFGLDLLIKDTKEHKNSVYLAEIKRQFAIYGKTHEVRFLNARMIRTMDPKNMQAVLGLNAKDFGLQPLREGLAMPLFDRGINTTDGEYWQYSRSLIKPTFSRVEICNLTSLEFHFGRLLDLIPRDRSKIDLQPLFSRLVRCLIHIIDKFESKLHYAVLFLGCRFLRFGLLNSLTCLVRHSTSIFHLFQLLSRDETDN